MRRHIKHTLSTHKRKLLTVAFLTVLSLGGYVAYFRFFGLLPQSTIYLFQTISDPSASDRIIIFSPHQDDETLGAGAYIARAKEVGASVTIVFATDGNHRHLKSTRQQEAVLATHILGVSSDNLIFYNYPDEGLQNDKSALTVSIKQTLDKIKPTKTFVTDPSDIHPDHAQLGISVAQAEKESGQAIESYTFLIHYPKYPRPQLYNPHDYLLPPPALISQTRQWLRFDVTADDIDKKNEAILQYKSQLRTPILHSLMLSFVRQNELFAKEAP